MEGLCDPTGLIHVKRPRKGVLTMVTILRLPKSQKEGGWPVKLKDTWLHLCSVPTSERHQSLLQSVPTFTSSISSFCPSPSLPPSSSHAPPQAASIYNCQFFSEYAVFSAFSWLPSPLFLKSYCPISSFWWELILNSPGSLIHANHHQQVEEFPKLLIWATNSSFLSSIFIKRTYALPP